LVETAIDDERIVVPREVYREVRQQEDALSELVHRHAAAVAEPSEQVQVLAGQYQATYFTAGLRDRADPFVMAEAKIRSATVVTYEGMTFSGKPARGAERRSHPRPYAGPTPIQRRIEYVMTIKGIGAASRSHAHRHYVDHRRREFVRDAPVGPGYVAGGPATWCPPGGESLTHPRR
jgi:hypothetical protein